MSGKHAYGADSKNRLTTLGYLALVALVLNFSGVACLTALFEIPHLRQFKPYTWPVSPITMTGAFGIVYFVYNRVLWKKLSKTPNLSGTWIGVVLPNYQTTWPHMEVLTIDQSWSEISVQGDVFFKDAAEEPWSLEKRLGTYKSTAAGMTDITAERANVIISYIHIGQRKGQPDFQGSMYLDYYRLEQKLDGKYYTNRMDYINGKQGSLGPVLLHRVSTQVIRTTDALALGEKDGLLKHLERQIMHGIV